MDDAQVRELLLSAIVGNAGTLLQRTAFAVLAWLFFLACGLWLPLMLLWRKERAQPSDGAGSIDGDTSENRRTPAWILALGTGGGVMTAVLFWTISIYTTRGTGAGTVVLIVLAAAALPGFRSLARLCRQFDESLCFAVATLLALLLAAWHITGIELPHESDFLFCDRHGDLGQHAYFATLVRDAGLPLVDLNGTFDREYEPLTHTGFSVLLVGLSNLTGRTLYEAAQFLWLMGYATIGWAALALVTRFRLPSVFAVLAAVAPLLWAGLVHLPLSLLAGDYIGATDPKLGTGLPMGVASGVIYHNGPQLWSIAVVAVGLVCFDQYSNSRRCLWSLGGGVLAISASGWIKPSLAVLFGPALLIYLLLRRARPTEFATACIFLAFGVVVYLLPEIVAELPPPEPWGIYVLRWDALESALLGVALLGVGSLAAVCRAWVVARDPRRLAELDWIDLSVIATVGGLIFAAVLREQNRDHENHLWGLYACAALLSPWVIVWCLKGDGAATSRAVEHLRRSTFALVAVQLVSGAIYAFYYPTFAIWMVNRVAAQALQQAGQGMPSGTRFVLDPAISTIHSESYVGHPVLRFSVLRYYARVPPSVEVEAGRWVALIERGELHDIAMLQLREAAVVHSTRPFLRHMPVKFGWQKVKELAGGFELWINVRRAPAGPQ